MKPGLYRVTDFIPLATVKARRQREDWHFLNFAGSDNEFLCEGVTIELDTALRKALNPPIHTDEFVLSGSRITLRGLTIRCTGDGISMGGALLGVIGKENTVSGCTLHVQPDYTELIVAGNGMAAAQFVLPNSPSLSGTVFWHQMVTLSLSGPLAITATNALRLTAGSF